MAPSRLPQFLIFRKRLTSEVCADLCQMRARVLWTDCGLCQCKLNNMSMRRMDVMAENRRMDEVRIDNSVSLRI